jgi:mono/diheme cytochrome c family protein
MRSLAPAALAILTLAAPARAEDAGFANPGRLMQQDGAAIYAALCQGCHMPGGIGAVGAGAYPALAANARLAIAGYPIALIVKGQKAMPSFAGMLSDAQIAAVVDYVRTHFGNDYQDRVDPESVKAARQ